ncbi:MAG: FecR domain-containing protein [Verrucomicrobiae bacterium]|nr:FecR domain-containing protein [Verrucomicrobiae bacterium]
MPLTAAAVVCLSFFLFISFFNRAESLVFVEFADGAVFRNDLSTAILESGSELPAGTVQIESASGSAQLRFDDGTLVTLEGESELAISDSRQGKWLQLRSGRLSADVAAQPADAPLRITTPTAEAEVLGTALSLNANAEETGLAVDEGLVRLRRLVDGQSVEVPARHEAIATLHSTGELLIRASSQPSSTWRLDPEASDVRVTKGEPIQRDGQLVYLGQPYLAGHASDGAKQVRSGIAINGEFVSLNVNSRFRLRYHSESPLTVFLVTQRENGGFGGNFECRLESEPLLPDSNGWREALVSMSDFQPVAALRHRGFHLDGNTVTKIIISVHGDESIQLATLAVTDE